MVLIGVAAVAVLALAAAVANTIRSLRALDDALADPVSIAEPIIDEMLSSIPGNLQLRADDPLITSRKILVTANINERTAKDVVARLLYMNALDPHRPIDLYLSTQGGWVDSAFTIIDAMQLIEAPVNTWAIGGCYSSGALILAAGTGRRYATPNAVLMIHASLDEDTKQSVLVRAPRPASATSASGASAPRCPTTGSPWSAARSTTCRRRRRCEFKMIDEIRPLRIRGVTEAAPAPRHARRDVALKTLSTRRHGARTTARSPCSVSASPRLACEVFF